MTRILIFLFLLVSNFVIAQNTEWEVVSSSIKFKIKNAGINVDGNLGGLKAKIIFDESIKSGNSIEATLESNTINTNNNSRDGHLKKLEYFNTSTFPSITMKATQFVKDKNGSWIGLFKLTLKGVTKDVYVPFVIIQKNNSATFKGTFSINRIDYGIGKSSMILSDNAVINIELYTTKK